MADKNRDTKRQRLLKECAEPSQPDYTMPLAMTLRRPTALEIARGTACTAEAYITELIQLTAPSLESCLALPANRGGIGHAGNACQQMLTQLKKAMHF